MTREEVKSDNVSIIATRQPGNRVKMEITVTPEATDAAYQKAVKQINKDVSVPGFRKGKAPDEMIIKHYSPRIDNEWRGLVFTVGLQEALQLLPKLYPYKKEEVRCTEVKELSREKGSQFTLEFEVSPQVPVINLSDITLHHVERSPVNDAAMNQVIDNLRLRMAQWESVTDRPVQADDYVDLDIDKLDDPQEVICKEARFAVADMAPWMKKVVIGLNVGESGEGISERDAAAAAAEKEDETATFRPTRCKIAVRNIIKPVLPEINDAFCQRLGVPNRDELQQRIIADLNRNADAEVTENLRRQVDQQLLERYHFELPGSMLEAEKAQRLADADAWLKTNNTPQASMEKQKADLERVLPDQVERSCRLFFLIMTFANQHKITVTPEEVAQEMTNQILQGRRLPTDRTSNEIRDRLAQQLLLRKTRDFIISHVKRQ